MARFARLPCRARGFVGPGLLVSVAAWLVLPGSVEGQTRFSVTAGGMIPLGGFSDVVDPSLRFGLRGELQPLDSLGRLGLVSFYAYGAYTDLALPGDLEAALVAAGQDRDASLLEAGGGLRVYSKVAPFFLQGGVGYVRYRPAGDADAENGADVHGGLGFLVPLSLVLVEVDAALHYLILDTDDFQFVSGQVALALPF